MTTSEIPIRRRYRNATVEVYRQIADPLLRYFYALTLQDLDEQQVDHDRDMRARALAELHLDGWSYAKIARKVGLSRARVQQLVERGREVAIRLTTEPPSTEGEDRHG